jgi:transposase
MNATATFPVVGVDLSKHVFDLAVADKQWRIVERARLTRSQFERWFANRAVGRVVMESCGGAHHWGRWLAGMGITAKLLPAQYVRAYVKRNKTDAADAAALVEALRCSDLAPVRIKGIEQQALQALLRTRSLWMATRTSRINALRGFCREFGICISQGSRIGLEQIGRQVADLVSSLLRIVDQLAGSRHLALTRLYRDTPLRLALGAVARLNQGSEVVLLHFAHQFTVKLPLARAIATQIEAQSSLPNRFDSAAIGPLTKTNHPAQPGTGFAEIPRLHTKVLE